MSGEVTSTTLLTGIFRCCVLHDGTNGAETGVNPVPPTINESKLNCMPVDGVVIEIPAISCTLFFVRGAVAATLREFGLLGFEIGTVVELSINFLAGGGSEKS